MGGCGGPSDGPVLGPFRIRTGPLQAERGWLASGISRKIFCYTINVRHVSCKSDSASELRRYAMS